MAIKSENVNLNYLEDDTGINTRITMYSYKRPRPSDKVQMNPYGFITFPLPVSMPTDDYSMNIGEASLGLLGNVANIDVNKNPNDMIETIAERLALNGEREVARKAAAGLVGIIAAAPGVSDILSRNSPLPLAISETARAYAGIVENPSTALLFNGVNLRTFTFTWRFSPRSQKQSRTLNDALNALKRAMHPNLAVYNFALDYPDLFKIKFNSDKEGIVNVDYSFLKQMSVNPTPAGHAYYKDGYPSVIDLTLTFEEIAIKTAENFGEFQMSGGDVANRNIPGV